MSDIVEVTTGSAPGYLTDYISKQRIKAGREEIDAVQPFSRRLVEDYKYPADHLQTRPQFRIKAAPSGIGKYPVDIAVFRSTARHYDNLYMIVECKAKDKLDGEQQLKLYMGLSSAQLGIWYNGVDHLYLQKLLDMHGNVTFRELPDIPQFGQRVEDIGRFTSRALKKGVLRRENAMSSTA